MFKITVASYIDKFCNFLLLGQQLILSTCWDQVIFLSINTDINARYFMQQRVAKTTWVRVFQYSYCGCIVISYIFTHP